MHGSYKKGDTAVDYHDDPSKHGKTEVTVIKRTPTPASEARAERISRAKAPSVLTTNTTAAATVLEDTMAPAATAHTTDMVATAAVGTVTNCDCINMNLIYTAIAVFGLAAIIGMYLITLLMRDRKRPLFASIVHGLFATCGLTLFVIYCIHQPGPLASLTIMVIAALCGLVLIYHEVIGRPVPKWLGALHGVLAVVGFILLLIFAFAH